VVKKILIADFEEKTLASLSYALQNNEVEITTCNDFEQAADALVTNCYDLFITDIGMQGARVFKSLELLGFIKRHFCTEVIVISGYNWRESEKELCRLNGLYFLNEPLDIKEVLKICEGIKIPIKNKKMSP